MSMKKYEAHMQGTTSRSRTRTLWRAGRLRLRSSPRLARRRTSLRHSRGRCWRAYGARPQLNVDSRIVPECARGVGVERVVDEDLGRRRARRHQLALARRHQLAGQHNCGRDCRTQPMQVHRRPTARGEQLARARAQRGARTLPRHEHVVGSAICIHIRRRGGGHWPRARREPRASVRRRRAARSSLQFSAG